MGKIRALFKGNTPSKTSGNNQNSVFEKIRRGLCEAIAYERKMKSAAECELNTSSEHAANNTTIKIHKPQ